MGDKRTPRTPPLAVGALVDHSDGDAAPGLVERGAAEKVGAVIFLGLFRREVDQLDDLVVAEVGDCGEGVEGVLRRGEALFEPGRNRPSRRCGCGIVSPRAPAAGVVMAFKLVESAQVRWRAVNAPHLVASWLGRLTRPDWH